MREYSIFPFFRFYCYQWIRKEEDESRKKMVAWVSLAWNETRPTRQWQKTIVCRRRKCIKFNVFRIYLGLYVDKSIEECGQRRNGNVGNDSEKRQLFSSVGITDECLWIQLMEKRTRKEESTTTKCALVYRYFFEFLFFRFFFRDRQPHCVFEKRVEKGA